MLIYDEVQSNQCRLKSRQEHIELAGVLLSTKNNNIPQLINKVRPSMFNFAAHAVF